MVNASNGCPFWPPAFCWRNPAIFNLILPLQSIKRLNSSSQSLLAQWMHKAGEQHLQYLRTGSKNRFASAQAAWCFQTRQGWGWELCAWWASELKGGDGGGHCLLDAAANSIQQLPRALRNPLIPEKCGAPVERCASPRKIKLLESFPRIENQYVLPRRGCIFVKFSMKSSTLLHFWASVMVLSTILHCRDAAGKRWYHRKRGLQPHE